MPMIPAKPRFTDVHRTNTFDNFVPGRYTNEIVLDSNLPNHGPNMGDNLLKG